MSVRVMNWVWHDDRTQHLKGNAVVAMLALADIADDEGNVVFARDKARTQTALANKARMSIATFRRHTHDLERDGLLSIERETATSVNEYRILLTAQNERSELSGRTAQTKRSHRSPVSGRTSLIRTDVINVMSEAADAPLRSDVGEILDLLEAEVERNGGKRPARSRKSIDAARLLIDVDGRTVDEISHVIRWCQADEFWRANVLSMSKLREKFDQLRLQALRPKSMSALEASAEADRLIRERESTLVVHELRDVS